MAALGALASNTDTIPIVQAHAPVDFHPFFAAMPDIGRVFWTPIFPLVSSINHPPALPIEFENAMFIARNKMCRVGLKHDVVVFKTANRHTLLRQSHRKVLAIWPRNFQEREKFFQITPHCRFVKNSDFLFAGLLSYAIGCIYTLFFRQ